MLSLWWILAFINCFIINWNIKLEMEQIIWVSLYKKQKRGKSCTHNEIAICVQFWRGTLPKFVWISSY